ncbi:MAG TPA: inorganic phosphate transporter [Bryobacteraceae bacterium]|nr:inorganic phosphate transporter [Bryobacteraceae bacterium]
MSFASGGDFSFNFLVIAAIGLGLAFEFVNGFHDTANAVATVIYTHSLRPAVAVIWSGIWNLIGVLTSSGAVAFAVVSLLPVELVLNVSSAAGVAMVMSLLVSAMIWNLGTWYLGLPASSSHTLIGSILGVGLANSYLSGGKVFGEGVNWGKAGEVFASLVTSPVIGFVLAAGLLLLCKAVVKRPELYLPADPTKVPPPWIRGLLIFTCTGVSFAHGSNDGQKGMGLLMLILIGLMPAGYAVDLAMPQQRVVQLGESARSVAAAISAGQPEQPATLSDASEELSRFLKTSAAVSRTLGAAALVNFEIARQLEGKTALTQVTPADRPQFRTLCYLGGESVARLQQQGKLKSIDAGLLSRYRAALNSATRFIPGWVKVAVALSLGLGTMIGWKRIVVTVGEKIGKEHMSYAQGASAELVAMTTIGAADLAGLPVSTTHVLSSGIAGTMVANNSGLQTGTLRNLLLAWVLTLPVCVFLGATLFAASLNIFSRMVLR